MDIQRLASLIRQLQGALAGRRLEAGRVSGSGVLVLATPGVQVTYNGTGDYTLTFDPPFRVVPAVQLTVGNVSAVRLIKEAGGSTTSETSCRVATIDTAGAPQDTPFTFIAAG